MFIVNWNSDGRKALGGFAVLNSLFGLWPLEKDSVYLRIRWFISTFSLLVLTLQAAYDSYLNCVNVENNADNLYSITFGIIGLSKLIFYYKHRGILRLNVEAAVEDWSSKDSKNFNSIMWSNRNNYKMVTQCVLALGCCAGSSFMIKVFFLDPDVTISVKSSEFHQDENVTILVKPRFILPAACIFPNPSESVFWTIILGQLVQSAVGVGVNLCCDGFFIAITSHLCAQFEILKMKFTNIPITNNSTEMQREFGILIGRHKHLLKLAKQLETAFSMIVFTQMAMNFLILNVAGFNFLVLLKKRDMLGAISNAAMILFELVQTFLYSYIGDRLTSLGSDIAHSVYHCKWYSMPSSLSKNVMFVIGRTRLPIGLTAGSFFKMTRGTFTDIVKTAVSYLSVLRVLIKDA